MEVEDELLFDELKLMDSRMTDEYEGTFKGTKMEIIYKYNNQQMLQEFLQLCFNR